MNKSNKLMLCYVMLYLSVNLSRAHWYKEKFLEILDCKDRKSAKQAMFEWIESAGNCGLPDIENVQIPCKIGAQLYLTLFLSLTQTVLPKVATTKLKSSNEMLTVTKISNDSETVFCIYFLINNLTNKQPPDDDCSYSKSILL